MERGMTTSPRIDLDRLLGRLDEFNRIGALPGGGNCRLALRDEDRAGRDLLVRWMRDLGLTVTVDAIGNIIGMRGGREDLTPVMFGSHTDTVGTGGRYDGLYGVLAGLEACEAINDAGRATRRPLALVAFTNEEGSRFPPYAMGSLVYVGGLALQDAYAVRGLDGATVGEGLPRLCYVRAPRPRAPRLSPAAWVPRTAHRARTGPGERRRRHRRGRGHHRAVVDRGRDHRAGGPRRHDADAPAARRRLGGGRDRGVRAPPRAGHGRPSEGNRRPHRALPQSRQCGRGAGGVDDRPAQHR